MRNTKLESLTWYQVNELLETLKEKQDLLKEGEYLQISQTLLDIILFEDETKTKIRSRQSLKGLDLSNISFSGVDISGVNFTGSIGAKINPQTIKNKSCTSVNFNGVEIIGSFNDCEISGANFKGSKGVKINPQEIKDKVCRHVIFEDAEITDSFDNCVIYGANFKGSTGAKINPQTIKDKDCTGIDFANTEIIGSFEDCTIHGSKFKGSKGAKINPQTIKDKGCNYINFADTEITGSFDGCNIYNAKFKGSKGAKIDPKKVDMETISDSDFADVEFLDVIYKPNNIWRSSFEGSINAVINMQDNTHRITWVHNTNLADVKLIYDEDLDFDTKIPSINLAQKYLQLIKSNNILTESTTINGLGLSYFLQITRAQKEQFNSYLEELSKSPQRALKIS